MHVMFLKKQNSKVAHLLKEYIYYINRLIKKKNNIDHIYTKTFSNK